MHWQWLSSETRRGLVDHTECLEFKRFVAKGLRSSAALKRPRRPAWVPRLLFTNHLSWEIDDQAGLDEGEQLASGQLACAGDLPLFGEIVENALVPSGSDETVEYMFCSDTRLYGRRAKATEPYEWTTDVSPQSQPFDPAVAKWPDGCTVFVPEILSLTCQTWKTKHEEASCTKRRKGEPHFQGRTKSGAEVEVKTTPQAKRDPLVILYVGAKKKPGPRVCREHHDAPCRASLLQRWWTWWHVQHEGCHCR